MDVVIKNIQCICEELEYWQPIKGIKTYTLSVSE